MNKVETIFSNLAAKYSWNIPTTFSFPKKTLLEKIRIQQWNQYQKSYKKFASALTTSVKESKGKIHTIDLSTLGQVLGVDKIQDKIFVPQQTKLAMMCCIDEGTQSGDFVQEENLDGHLLGTISDPNIPRYLIDMPGSGALLFETDSTKDCTKSQLIEKEEQKMDEIAECIVKWCQKNEIIKFTVTYHAGCGAVHKRFDHNPDICSGKELDFAKKIAKKTAIHIHDKAIERKYPLEVTLAFIGDTQMSKTRPPELHNALGTAACLDSRVSVCKLDTIIGTNFFEVSIFNEMVEDADFDPTSRDFLANAIHDIDLTVQIATGPHGWNNEHFDEHSPYPVMLFAGSQKQGVEAEKIFNVLGNVFPQSTSQKLGFYIIRTDL
jgi:hypothetical protein